MGGQSVAGGRFRLERPLGHGGIATVYLGYDSELDRPVAIKVLAENLAGDEAFRRRFLREARLSARLSHPNVVSVYDAGEEADGRPYIVTELVDGETLAEVLSVRGPLPADETAALAVQACRGLAHAHAAGLVHRDVKPQNLLLRPDGTLKVADFGIARAAEGTALTQAGTVLGTAAYLSPEQALGQEATPAGDVYSLGAVLYELLTGRPPYELDSLADLAAKQAEGAITPVRELAPGVPQRVEDAIMRSLARNPAYRPASADEFAQELEPSVTTTAALPRPRPARRGLWIALAAVLVPAAILLGIALATRDSGGKPPAKLRPPRGGADPARSDSAGAGEKPERLAPALLALGAGGVGGGGALAAEADALAPERELHFLAGLVDPPLDRREGDLERVGDLGVGEADDVAQEERHLQVGAQVLDRAPEGVDLLDPLDRRVQHLERGDVVECDQRPRPALARPQLVQHAVLGHLEEPGRELRAERELRQPLVDAQEDLLRQVLGQRAVPADEPEDVVEDGGLVGAEDEGERSLVSALRLSKDAWVGLG
jgi:hypothetical protein